MKAIDILKRSNKNLLRSKTRTILTILAIMIGSFTLTLTLAIGQGAQKFIDDQVSTFKVKNTFRVTLITENSTESPGTPQKYNENKKTGNMYGYNLLTDKDITKIENTKGITSVQPSYDLTPDYITRSGQDKYVISVSGYTDNVDYQLEAGTLPQVNEKGFIIIPNSYVKALGFSNPDDAINKEVTIAYSDPQGNTKTTKNTIRGVLVNSVFVSGIGLINYDEAKSLYQFQNTGTEFAGSYFNVYASYSSSATQTDIDKIKSDLKEKSYEAQTFDDAIKQVKSVIDIVQTILSIFGFIAILASTFGISNTLIMSIYERKHEIGLMKALGMGRLDLFKIFAIEATSIGFWGGLMGAALAILAGKIANQILSQTYLKDFYNYELLSFTPEYVALVVLFLMVIGFLAGTLPSIRASRLDPITALREE